MSDDEEDPDIPRIKLPSFSTLQHVIDAIRKAKRIIVITGAGISVSSGIPDFRSKDIGIYHTLDCDQYNIPSAELLFDYEFFRIDAEPFYKFSSNLLPNDDVRPSPCHNFIACLQARGKLLRNYTQNVDGLERKAGITKLIECHGSMMNFSCMDCKRKKKLADVKQEVIAGAVAYCRSPSCGGTLKPDITFFGELLPQPFFKAIKTDVSKCDLVIVIGTSLKVGGSVHLLLKHVEDRVPQVLINREAVNPPASVSGGFDVSLLGECDNIAKYLSDALDWPLEPLADSQYGESRIEGDLDTAEGTMHGVDEKPKKGGNKTVKVLKPELKEEKKVKVEKVEGDQPESASSSSSSAPSSSSTPPSSSSSSTSMDRWVCSQTEERIFTVTQNPKATHTSHTHTHTAHTARPSAPSAKVIKIAPSSSSDMDDAEHSATVTTVIPGKKGVKAVKKAVKSIKVVKVEKKCVKLEIVKGKQKPVDKKQLKGPKGKVLSASKSVSVVAVSKEVKGAKINQKGPVKIPVKGAVKKIPVKSSVVAVISVTARSSSGSKRRRGDSSETSPEAVPEAVIVVSKRGRPAKAIIPQIPIPAISTTSSSSSRRSRVPVKEEVEIAVIHTSTGKRKSGSINTEVSIIPVTATIEALIEAVGEEVVVSVFDDVTVPVKRGRGRPRKNPPVEVPPVEAQL